MNRGLLFKAIGDQLNWTEAPYEEYPPANNLIFNSCIRGLFCLADELYVATENGGLYRVDGVPINLDMCVVRCEIVETD